MTIEVFDEDTVVEDVSEALLRVITERGLAATSIDESVTPVIEAIAELASGGKRVRATLVGLGWQTANPRGDDPAARLLVRDVGVALEIFHLGALIHDDIMDSAATRRGVPTIHSRMADTFHGSDPRTAGQFGRSAAILAGDLCFGWAAGVFSTAVARHPSAARATEMFDAMRSELMVGQYLDIASDVRSMGSGDLVMAMKIARLKTARYSVDFPLQVGAYLGFATDETRACLSRFALAIGEAYQLRDDLLGAFGSSFDIGKSGQEDLVNGKNTTLWCETRRRASAAQLRELDLLVAGDSSQSRINVVRQIMVETGSVRRIEELIEERYRTAREALRGVPSVPSALSALARQLAYRDH